VGGDVDVAVLERKTDELRAALLEKRWIMRRRWRRELTDRAGRLGVPTSIDPSRGTYAEVDGVEPPVW
jgi:hypothetical protein